jgi:dimethylaniline monooxygenase (N-oxide forming)
VPAYPTAAIIGAGASGIELSRRALHPDSPDPSFVALVQPLGVTMPIAEMQGRSIADQLRGEYARPARAAMLRDIRGEDAAMRKRYVASKRHTIQIDFDDYLRALARERRAGAERARAAGFPAPAAAATAAAAASDEAVAA